MRPIIDSRIVSEYEVGINSSNVKGLLIHRYQPNLAILLSELPCDQRKAVKIAQRIINDEANACTTHSNNSQLVGVPNLTALVVLRPNNSPRYFGAKPNPGLTLLTCSAVTTSPTSMFFTK